VGLVSGLLMLPLLPVRGVIRLADELQHEAYRQWSDPAAIQAQLAEIEASVAAGELAPEDAEPLQDELVSRLLATRESGP
jgi:hypothetical protein